MAFTMHSHSGQFCPGHAVDGLEDVVKKAIATGFKTLGLSEHMPRYEEAHLYPEELDDVKGSLEVMPPRHLSYLAEAQRLQDKYKDQIHILIGFEAEFIDASFKFHVSDLAKASCVDYFIGSVHHTHGIPIDYNADMYAAAIRASSRQNNSSDAPPPSEEQLYEDYYDLQYQMLLALQPRVIGHFDLIRLFSADPGRDVSSWNGVWTKIKRNLSLVRDQGGLLECNTAALRKGLEEPYPGRVIATEWLSMGGKFTISDDSHGTAQIATNYLRGLDFLESLGVTEVWTFRRKTTQAGNVDELKSRKAELEMASVSIADFRDSLRLPEP